MPDGEVTGDSELCALTRSEPDAVFRSVRLTQGETLFRQGEALSTIWCVCSGSVILSRTGLAGRECDCTVRGPGSLLGLEVLHSGNAKGHAKVLSSGEFRVATVEDMTRWVAHGRQASLIEVLLREVATLNAEQQLRVGDALERVTQLLLQRQGGGLLSALSGAPLHVLSCVLNMRPETLSRTLQKLRRERLIAPESLRVLDPAALQASVQGSLSTAS